MSPAVINGSGGEAMAAAGRARNHLANMMNGVRERKMEGRGRGEAAAMAVLTGA